MRITDNTPMCEAYRKLMENIALSTMEYILQEGVDGMLKQFVGITKEQCRVFPHVAKAMIDKGLLQGDIK